MSTFCFFDVLQITDPKKMERYRKEVLETVDYHGGRYLIIGGPFEIVEGSWGPKFPVVIEFSTREQAYKWYASPEYRLLKNLRQKAAVTNAVFMHGF